MMPKSAWVRGMFIDALVRVARAHTPDAFREARYVAFMTYPLQEFMRVIVRTAELVHGDLPIREAVRRLGRLAYPTLFDTMVGKAIFTVAGRDWPSALKLAAKAYAVSLDPGKAEVIELSPGRAVVGLRQIWNFPDCYQVGVFEGAMDVFRVRGEIQVRAHSLADVDFLITWN
jgi:uncharacterized protein (TIGR02265 family)